MPIPGITLYEADNSVAFACLKHGFQPYALYFGVATQGAVPICPACVHALLQVSCAMVAVPPPKQAEVKKPDLKIAETPKPTDGPNPTSPPAPGV
jgi:hypothetical protein